MKHCLKVATYNIHKAVGLDRKYNPERILHVLRELDADIIALQEADKRFGRRESCLPFHRIDNETPWKHVPLDSPDHSIGWHGNAILVRDEMQIEHAQNITLPTLEPRGAIMADITTTYGPIRIVGTHLDLSGLWRGRQIKSLLSNIDSKESRMPTAIMGDFNQWSNRGAMREIHSSHYHCLQSPPSFHSTLPIACLDRIIISPELHASRAYCHKSKLSQKASDHLPLWAELEMPNF